ncbi:MAG: trypsin-like peptidase domain-containing protein [Betaproteobacteria bacterium]|nr:trypsin-like peptidase domain-containing protein [Betaproteobacteria bacterium]
MKKPIILVAALVAAAAAFSPFAQKGGSPESRPVSPRGPLLAQEQALTSLFESAAPSVAYITTERLERTSFFTAEVAKGAGSGFVWDSQGHVVTNFHVLQGARGVTVQLDAGQRIPATLVGVAPDYDLAVVKLSQVPRDLRPIPVGSSKELRVGQSVFAIGNPFGLSRTLTTGIVSALDRHLPTSEYREISGAIQTDAAINPGNSGGPLLDSAGRLVGVNTAIRSPSGGSSGVGFAIPVDLVNRIVPQLIARGKAALPGIGIRAVDPMIVARAGLTGVVVADVMRGSPAAEAGLRPVDRKTGEVGDVIIAVNGRPVEAMGTFAAELDRAGIDSTAELTVQRDKKERKVRVKVIDVQR